MDQVAPPTYCIQLAIVSICVSLPTINAPSSFTSVLPKFELRGLLQYIDILGNVCSFLRRFIPVLVRGPSDSEYHSIWDPDLLKAWFYWLGSYTKFELRGLVQNILGFLRSFIPVLVQGPSDWEYRYSIWEWLKAWFYWLCSYIFSIFFWWWTRGGPDGQRQSKAQFASTIPSSESQHSHYSLPDSSSESHSSSQDRSGSGSGIPLWMIYLLILVVTIVFLASASKAARTLLWSLFRGVCKFIFRSVKFILRWTLKCIGFTVKGVKKGTPAAMLQRIFYGAIIPVGSIFAWIQSFVMKGGG